MSEASSTYDQDNIFARILRGELPCQKVYEDDHVLAFHDIHPQAPVHVLVIPKGPYADWNAFASEASDEEIAAWVRATGKIAAELGVAESGFRALVNTGPDGNQEVPHLHLHLFAGGRLGRMIAKRT